MEGCVSLVGEYVTLYQQQRSILRQRTAEKDGYIFQLAHERLDMQSKLGELQVLVMKLLGERQMLHSYHDDKPAIPLDMTANAVATLANHVGTSSSRQHKSHGGARSKKADVAFGSNLDSSQLEGS